MLLTLGANLVLGACGAAIQSGTHVAPDADLRGRLTFAWDQESDQVVGDPRLEGNRFFEERLHEAIEWELSLRGIRPTDSSPDLHVHHHLTLTDHVWEQEIFDDAGGSRTETFTVEEGSVVVHVTDTDSRKDVWVGWARADVDLALVGPDEMREWVYALVAEMFGDWPVLARRPGS